MVKVLMDSSSSSSLELGCEQGADTVENVLGPRPRDFWVGWLPKLPPPPDIVSESWGPIIYFIKGRSPSRHT